MTEPKSIVCANFATCRKLLQAEDERVVINGYTYCKGCANSRTIKGG